MSTSARAAITLFCLSLSIVPLASGQSCADQMRQPASHQPGHTVSASDLRIPRKAWQHFEKARAASERNQPDVFERESAKALAEAPQFAEVYLLRAAREVRSGQSDAALAAVATARQIQPNLPWSSVVVASALNQLRRYTEAVAELDRARGDEADSWQAKYERARAETGRRDAEAALHWSGLAVAAAPVGCTDARLLRANAFQLAGRRSDAIVELETYLALDRQGTHRAQVLAAIEGTRTSAQEESRSLLARK